MNSNPIRKFCESRYRWPIVATATTLLALAAVLPQADDYFDKRSSRSELSENLVRARQTAESLPKFEQRAAEVRDRLEALQVRAIDDAALAKFRTRLVEIVREAGCQIRQVEVGEPTRRPWKRGDNPLIETAEGGTASHATPFMLERRNVVLAVDGALPAIHDLLSRLEKERTLAHPHRLQLQAATASGETVTLELELWLFALSRTAA